MSTALAYPTCSQVHPDSALPSAPVPAVIATWQERLPAPRTVMRCTMNCSPSNPPCEDCMPEKVLGNAVAARDAEIAELRATLAKLAAQSDQTQEAMNRACRDLPEFYEVLVELENGYGGVCWRDPFGAAHDIEGDGNLAEDISEAIDKALEHAAAHAAHDQKGGEK